jgi:hypothetical protein
LKVAQIAGYERQSMVQGCRGNLEIRIGEDCFFFFKPSPDSAVNLRGSDIERKGC